jgi:hypothetical protein
MTIRISVTRILGVALLVLMICALLGFTRDEALVAIWVSVLMSLILPLSRVPKS